MKQETIKVHEAQKPFSIVEQNKVFFITIGNSVVSEKQFKTKKEAEQYINEKPYELIINAVCFIYSKTQEKPKEETK